MGWSGGTRPVHLAGPRGMTMGTYAGIPPGAPMTAEMQEAARRQQRNALIAFVVMIVLFSLREYYFYVQHSPCYDTVLRADYADYSEIQFACFIVATVGEMDMD